MVCEKCKKQQATVHVTEVVNEQKSEAHLCEQCARNAGVGVKFTFSVSDILGNLIETPKPARGERAPAPQRCPECGLTYTEFKSKARFGCANDYEVFKAGLLPLLEKIHGSTDHVGKVPKTAGAVVKMESELSRLKRELDSAIKAEHFERAAELRDRVRRLEQELDRGEG